MLCSLLILKMDIVTPASHQPQAQLRACCCLAPSQALTAEQRAQMEEQGKYPFQLFAAVVEAVPPVLVVDAVAVLCNVSKGGMRLRSR